MHCEGMVRLFREFCDEHPRIVTDDFKREIYAMFRDGVALEDKVIDNAFEMGEIEGVSAEDIKNFFEGTVTDYNADGMVGEWGWPEVKTSVEEAA